MIKPKKINLILSIVVVICLSFGLCAYADDANVEPVDTSADILLNEETAEAEENEEIIEPADSDVIALSTVSSPVDGFDAEALGVNNVAVGKAVKGGQNTFGYMPKYLVDGKTNTSSAVEGSKITVDLGKRYPVTHFGFYTGNNNTTAFKITFSNASDFSDEFVALEMNDTLEGNTEYIYMLTTPASYRYVCLEGMGSNIMIFNELYVYSDASFNASAWTMTDKYGSTIKDGVAGKYIKSLKINVGNYTSKPAEAVVLVVLADENGSINSTVLKSTTLAVGPNPVDINVEALTDGAVPAGWSVTAYIMDSLSNGHLYASIYEG